MEKMSIFAVFYRKSLDSWDVDYQFIAAYTQEGAMLIFEKDYPMFKVTTAIKCNVNFDVTKFKSSYPEYNIEEV